MNRKHKYYFGRLNFIANIEDKISFLLKGLNSSSTIEKRENTYGFFDVKEYTHHIHGNIIEGYLVKYEKKSNLEAANEKNLHIENVIIQNRVIEKSRFFIKVKSSIIAFHPATGQKGILTFKNYFSELFELNFKNFMVKVFIEIISDEFNLLTTIPKFTFIKKITIILHPSNPAFRDRWEKYDERIKKLQVKKYEETYETEEEQATITIPENDEILDKISMAEDGYGFASVEGNINGKRKTITTLENPMTALADNNEILGQEVIEELSATIDEIDKRTKHEN